MAQSDSRKKATRAFLITLVVLIICSLLNWGVVSDWGNVKITRITIIGDNGVEYSAISYVPRTATNETPAPALLTVHGGSSNARNNEAWSMEFARRGFVVIAVDNFGGGDSEYVNKAGVNAAPEMFYSLLMNMDIVDNDRIVTNGHSWGNDAAYALATQYNAAACLICSGNNSCVAATYNGNLIITFGNVENVNTVEKYSENTAAAFSPVAELTAQTIENDKLYGSFEEGNAKLMHISPNQVHEGAMISRSTTEAIINFTQNAIDVPNPIDGSNQVWMWKDVFGQLGIIVFVFFLLTFANLLMECVPFFNKIKQPLPQNMGLRGPGMAISVAAGILFPILSLYTGGLGLKSIAGITGNKFINKLFAMRAGNFAFYAFVGIAVLGIIMLFVFHFTEGKKHNAKLRDYGLTSEGKTRIDWSLIGRSTVLAVVTILAGWTYINYQTGILGTDFYCLYWGVKDITSVKFTYYIPYIIAYSILFCITSLGLNVERRLPSTGNEKKDMIRQMFFNILMACAGVTIIVVLQSILQNGIVGGGTSAMASWGIEIVRVWGMPVGMVCAGIGQTYLFRKSGSVYPGAFIMGTYCALCCVLYAQTRI